MDPSLIDSIVKTVTAQLLAQTPKSVSKTSLADKPSSQASPSPLSSKSNELNSSVKNSLQKNSTPNSQPKKPSNKRDVSSQAKKKKLSYENHYTHAVVHWICDKKYSVVQISAIQTNEIVRENNVYKIQFNKTLYEGKIITLGSLDGCKKHLELMPRSSDSNKENDCMEVDKEKETASKKPKETKSSQDFATKSTREKELEAENDALKAKILEIKVF